MPAKEKMNVLTDPWIARQFREVAKSYDNRLGMCLSAAMLMFIRADPHSQGDSIRQVFDEEVRAEVDALVQAIKDGHMNREGRAAKSRSGDRVSTERRTK
jgi:hypothetical protein